MYGSSLISLLAISLSLSSISNAAPTASSSPGDPFLVKVDNETAIIGNDLWNVTVGRQYATELYYSALPGVDLVGNASGHYVSYNGAASQLNLTNPRIASKSGDYTDIAFTAPQGDFHWVLTPTLAGAYQYFVNRALPTLGEFRTLWRLDNTTFTQGWTTERDEELPPLADIEAAEEVQDETFQRADGTNITKYDFSSFLNLTQDGVSVWGVYGEGVGSWFIHGGKEYFNGNQLKQELTVHRESETGDAVQLNMIHGTHFMTSSEDEFGVGRTWGPWLWYLNDGSSSDALSRAESELSTWPYPWANSTLLPSYNTRGSLSGRLLLSDSRPASSAAIFLGDSDSSKPTLQQGANYYYRTYTDSSGCFVLENVRAGTYGLYAWADGGTVGDVLGTFSTDGVEVNESEGSDVGDLTWELPGRERVFQIGTSDRKGAEFPSGGPPHEHARSENCPADLTYTVGSANESDWCFAQTKPGNWTIAFDVPSSSESDALLSVSLAAYSQGTEADILVNEHKVGNISTLANDKSLYRSATVAGEWRLLEFPVEASMLVLGGSNEVTFRVTESVDLRGWIWDTVVFEWA